MKRIVSVQEGSLSARDKGVGVVDQTKGSLSANDKAAGVVSQPNGSEMGSGSDVIPSSREGSSDQGREVGRAATIIMESVAETGLVVVVVELN